jgi:PAS domain S-box-containing protein
MRLADSGAEQIKLIEELLKETKGLWQKIKELESSQENCQVIIDAQKVAIGRYRTAIKYLPYGIYVKDSEMKYLFCNEAYAQLINMRPLDIRGRTDWELFSRQRAAKYLAGEQRVWHSSEAMEVEETHFVNGEERTFLAARRLIKGEEGNITNLLGVLIDITERKRQEEQWKQHSLERFRQIESLMSDVEKALKFAGQQEDSFNKLRASLEMQISLRDAELERLRNEFQQHVEAEKKTAHILLTKVADLHDFVASVQKYLDSLGKAP